MKLNRKQRIALGKMIDSIGVFKKISSPMDTYLYVTFGIFEYVVDTNGLVFSINTHKHYPKYSYNDKD